MARKPSKTGNAMNPLPGLLRASAWDAGNASMRAAGRSKWSRKDFNEAAATQERLITACYSLPTDSDPHLKFIRFQIAESWERQGAIDLYTDWTAVMAQIEKAITA